MERILVSSCLLGQPVRYDGRAKTSDSAILARWRAEGRLVTVCPEVSGGLPIPRPPAEITGASVRTAAGEDVTEFFTKGAELALATAARWHIRMAILKEGSPSCGSHRIYDGAFTGQLVEGSGITATLLTRHGIRVFSEEDIAAAERWLQHLQDG